MRGAKTVALAGTVDHAAVAELIRYCEALAERGHRRLVIDMTAVSGCDHDGLLGLDQLAEGWCGLATRVAGARWSQFLPALLAVEVGELASERARVRALIDPPAGRVAARAANGARSGPLPRHRPATP